jgi:glycerophosphoryl diester phosphodiesterase
VHETALAELKTLEAGNGESIPTLAEALALIGDRALLNIELKGFTGHTQSLPEKVVKEVSAAGLSETILYSSFSVHLLTELQSIQPEAKIGWLFPPGPAARFNLLFRPGLPLYSLHPHQSLLNTGLLRRAKRWGLKVFVYTVNDPVKTKKMFEFGVDGIFTDDPAAAQIIRDNWGAA